MKDIRLINNLIHFLLFSSLLATNVQSQGKELIGIIENRFVILDSLTGRASELFDIQNLEMEVTIDDLAFHETNQTFYGIKNISNSPKLVSISKDGVYQEIGPLLLDTDQIELAEAVAYNTVSDKLYMSVSLNGGVNNGDFFSESIVEVNTSNATCVLITEINTSHINPDIDAMTFNENTLYLIDGAPPSANFLTIYSLEFSGLTSVSNPTTIYHNSYLPIRDILARNSNIYFVENRNLRKFNLNNSTIQTIGTTHESTEFNGNLIRGLSELELCQAPIVDLGDDAEFCIGEQLVLDPSVPQSSYEWHDGSSTQTFTVTQSGIYWVDVENPCGVTRDSIEVIFNIPPEIELGEDIVTCQNSVILDASFPNSSFEWQDGSTNSNFMAVNSGTYWVDIENSCGIFRDSLEILFVPFPVVDLGDDLIECSGELIVLDASSPNSTYLWQDGSTERTLLVRESGTYWVQAKTLCGMTLDSIKVLLPDLTNPFIPNAFSPNSDGYNDYFRIDSEFDGASLAIYERTGIKVFGSINYENDWDGGNMPSGIYYYLIIDICGNYYKGWVQILR